MALVHTPPPSPLPPPPDRVRWRTPEPLVLATWLTTLGVIGAHWQRFPSIDVPIDLATAATALYFGWKASLVGGLWEFLSLARLGGGLAVGFFGKEFFAGLFGAQGVLGTILGFYTGFLFTYLGVAVLLYFVKDQSQLPGPVDRCAGFLLGVVEAVLLVGVVGVALTPFAGPAEAPTTGHPLATSLVEQAVAPLVPESASGTIELLKVAAELRQGFDPQQIDREALFRQFEPLAQHPRLQELAQDQELRGLVERGENPAQLLQHPKIRALLSDPELVRLATSIDLHKVAAALRRGVVRPARTDQ